MLAVISPSKTQDFTKIPIKQHTKTRQIDDSKRLISTLKTKSQTELKSLMSISDKLAKLNFERFQNFPDSLNLDNAKPAIFAFKGAVYDGLDISSFSAQDLDFAQHNLRILSGLYGVIRPLDLIAPYRLEMGVKLKTRDFDNLYQFWGDKISQILNQDEDNTIINLASLEYFKGIKIPTLKAKIINIVFKEKKPDGYKIIGIYAKRARGLMANYIIKNHLTDPAKIKNFTTDGYQFRPDFSEPETWVFCRN